ncbi:polysaccharide biosynthesis tyrosine autokinase [Deltaproteobacteria bacterium IMCC39524]|nr:polysaccharide biosynthesis tyrosine autokinase [Deltaproteobacteria bacterium IMCC39524]
MQIGTQDVHLRDYLRIINKRRVLVASVFLGGFLLVILAAFSMTPQYKGSTRLLIEKAANADFQDESSRFDPYFYSTQYELIQSDAVGRRVVRMLGLDSEPASLHDAAISGGLGGWVTSVMKLVKNGFGMGDDESSSAKIEPQSEILARQISAGIEVSPSRKSRIAEINYFSTDPEFAAQVANSVAQAYIEETLEMKLNFTRITIDWMTRKAEEEGAKLEVAENRLQQYMVENNILTLGDRMTVTPEQLSQLSSDLLQTESRRRELEALYAKASSVINQPELAEALPAVANDPSLQMLRSQILQAEQLILDLSNKFGPKHPTMKKAVSDLASLKNKKKLEIKRIIASIGNEYELARNKEESLQAQFNQTQGEAMNLNQKVVQYAALKRDVDANRQLYDALMLKIKEQSLTQDTQPVNVWIVEKATVPTFAVKPNKKKFLLGGFVGCLFLGIALAFFIEYLDNTVKSPEETERRLGISVLGVISLWAQEQGEVENAVSESPRSAFAENYKALRAAVQLSKPEGAPKSILITSPGPSAGKTTTAVNLATALAQSEKKVLLIDADLRKPRVHKVFSKSNKHGLSSYLSGGDGKQLLQKGPIENLTLITAGPIPPNPSELLSSKRMAQMIEDLSANYDVIICDSPPLMSVSDARVLSNLFEGTILVVRAHLTPFDLARKAIKSLADVNAPLLGMVINAIELKKSDYYYNDYYTSYGDEPEEESVES